MNDKPRRVPLPICGVECLCCSVIPERAIDAVAHSSIGPRRRATGPRRARPGGPVPPGTSACGTTEAQP
ncbi:hypothetical protein [Nocardia sp. XZ_19_369]|uniref:hypothetical protein n=1 Tax=Nocardia sp. XZ_19_369 TaxID=2769487 RepID=UPI0018900AE4|nr:hypothetical protein [Nocardia sp. XZ_19_369]